MPNAVTPTPSPTAQPPRLTVSIQRLLADRYATGDEAAAWEPPPMARRPDPRLLASAVRELERGLAPATAAHMRRCVHKLFVLPSAAADMTSAALMADNFIDACGHLPDDLWSAGTLELLQTRSFRPTPAELIGAVGPRLHERRRMLERAKQMLAPATAAAGAKAATRFAPEPEAVRLKATVERWRRHRDSFLAPVLRRSAERAERRLAELGEGA
jgi:hypothetical protein